MVPPSIDLLYEPPSLILLQERSAEAGQGETGLDAGQAGRFLQGQLVNLNYYKLKYIILQIIDLILLHMKVLPTTPNGTAAGKRKSEDGKGSSAKKAKTGGGKKGNFKR